MRIHAIKTGEVVLKRAFMADSVAAGGIPQFLWALRRDREWAAAIPIYAWLIEHAEGLLLIDTGELSGEHPGLLIPARLAVAPADELKQQLTRLGVRPHDIRQVIFTHLHSDHVNGQSAVAGRPMYASAAEVRAQRSLIGRFYSQVSTRLTRSFNPQPLEFVPAPIGAFTHSAPLTQDGTIRAVPTPGHTRGHLSVIVRERDCDIFIAGDVTYTQAALLQQQRQGPSMAPELHTQSLQRVLQHCQQTPTVYLPSHDVESATRLEQRQVVAFEQAAEPALARG